MPITYTDTRPSSEQATDLMARINALEEPISGGRWDETINSFGPSWTQLNGLNKIACDGAGYVYVEVNNGTTTDTSRRISKIAYDVGVDDLDLILYSSTNGSGTGKLLDVKSIDANSSALWVASTETFTTPGSLSGSLKKFDLDGNETAHVNRSESSGVGVQSGYLNVRILSNDSIIAIWYEEGVTPAPYFTPFNTYKVFSYSSSGGSESELLSFSLASGESIGNLITNDDDDFLITEYVGGVYTTKRYSSGGSFQSSLSNAIFTASFTNNEYYGSITGQSSYNVFDILGNGLDFITLRSHTRDLVQDENGDIRASYLNPSVSSERGLYYMIEVNENRDFDQTEFFRYPDPGALTNPESLGTPDGGVTIPATNALQYLSSGKRHSPHHGMLADMRVAIETVAPYYLNASTGNAYNTDQEDADNIFNVAIQAGQYDWTTPGEVPKQMMRGTDFSDMDLVLTELEGAGLA